eukprot:CAMPEP_0117841694 /NCGR_PEP_ID=MMETSP0949-20121206/15494_1 /TAXON_ID=44440 /ORGANISM="Chattonella subsalsa, Strain CCMP2191" /LENGTH=87 /DNA_ID=CAMNT_0005685445 /DNA_START=21 /DNA_END=280 /DNA_ORIENTATION=-
MRMVNGLFGLAQLMLIAADSHPSPAVAASFEKYSSVMVSAASESLVALGHIPSQDLQSQAPLYLFLLFRSGWLIFPVPLVFSAQTPR